MDSKRALVAWLLALVFTGCGHTAQKSQHAWEQVPHGEGESCTRVDRYVTWVCAGATQCGLYVCEDAGRLLAKGGGTIAPPAAPGSGPHRRWGNVQKLPGGNGPVFVFDWHNAPQSEHRAPLLPSGPDWVRHHLFPQAEHLAKWFARSPRSLNVHDFTLVIARDTHQRIHSGTRGGAWNQEWTDFARRYPGASQQQVWEHLGKLVQKYDLIGPIVPYYYLR
ncbi:TIGR02269 family lipoprotein [Myxococcus xanthus]|uniref:SitA6 family polymorphic toxin lipoprotein n=1 Tax=Myxococcus xanthus TaxID=34 RepID=UPI00112D27CD|nr:TIGR02269 family lipoprotein [Myxococcus xanthus]